jgi:hypothetical protein
MFILALLLAGPPSPPPLAPLTPQEPPPVQALAASSTFDPLSKGTAAVSFSLPGDLGSADIGVTYFIADNLAARVDFGLNAVFEPSGTPATFNIDLAVRWYTLKRGPVSIYLSPSFQFGRSIQAAGAAEFINFGGAVGVEYFFTEHLSAGAQLGVALGLNNIGGPAGTSVGVTLTTATTGLFASVYF